MHYPRLPNRYRVTGKVRFRRGWFGRLVPQVEEAVFPGRMPPPPGQDHKPDLPIGYIWRDARRDELDRLARFYYQPECPET